MFLGQTRRAAANAITDGIMRAPVVFLLGALISGEELRVAHCRDCSGVLVTDRLALRVPVCNECSGRQARSDEAPPT